MTDPLLINKIDEIETTYQSQYGSAAGVPDWLIVKLLHAPDGSLPLAAVSVSATDVRNILIRHGDYAKIELQASSATELENKLLALSALSVVNLITTIDFTDPQVLTDFTSNINKLVANETITSESVFEITSLINQQQSWSKYYNIPVTSQIIAEARK